MRFENKLDNYKTTEAINTASDYLKNAIERMEIRLKKISGCSIYIEQSRVSFFSNYIEFLKEGEDGMEYTIFKIRISDHTNNELHTEDADIRINGRLWKEIKKDIIEVVLNKFKS